MNEDNENMKGSCCGGGRRKWWLLIPVCVIAGIFGFGLIVMYLWNAVMPHVFTSLGPITYCQAIMLLILSKIFFGGFKGRGCGCGGRCGRGGRWGQRREWKEKWMSMSEEEKAKFKEEWKNRCC